MERVFKVSFVGLGWATKNIWLPRFAQHPGFAIHSVYDSDKTIAESLNDSIDDLIVATNLQEMVATKPDLVVIAVPNAKHLEVASYVLKNNISVFIEKPVCLNVEEYRKLSQVALESSGKLLVSKAARLRSDIKRLYAEIASGKVGCIYALDLAWLRKSGIPRPGSWFTTKSSAGGGAGYDLGWHILDVGVNCLQNSFDICDALGVIKPIALSDIDNKASWRKDALNDKQSVVDVEAQMIGFVKTSTNVAINFNAAWCSNVPCDVTIINVHGTMATLKLTTTFGFSSDRIKTPSLVMQTSAGITDLNLISDKIGNEYCNQVALLYEQLLLNDSNISKNCLHEIYPIVAILDKLYASVKV